jgi:ribosomal protein L7/L12
MNIKQEEIKAMILQFPVEEINELIAEISKALEIREFMKMKLAETGFTEWNDPEGDIYNVQAEDS